MGGSMSGKERLYSVNLFRLVRDGGDGNHGPSWHLLQRCASFDLGSTEAFWICYEIEMYRRVVGARCRVVWVSSH